MKHAGPALRPAVVGGLVGAGAVLLGIVVTEFFVRLRNRRDRLEQATSALTSASSVAVSILQRPVPPDLTEMPPPFNELIGQAALVRALARRPVRRHKTIRAKAEDYSVQLAVASMRWATKGPLTFEQTKATSGAAGQLHRAVFDREPINARIDAALRAEGIGTLDEMQKRAAETRDEVADVDQPT